MVQDSKQKDQMLQQHLKEVSASAQCLYTASEVNHAYRGIAETLTQKVANENPLCLCVVIGGIIPFGHIMMHLDFPLQMDYVHASRYQGKVVGAAELTWHAYPKISLKDRVVVLIDDIIDQGLTLKALVDYAYAQGAKKVLTAVLVDKPEARDSAGLAQADVVGLNIEPMYVFGSGLDYKGYLRNIPGIYAVDPRIIANMA